MPTNKQERERARRNLQQQLERRREAEARRRKTTLAVTVVATLAVIGVVLGLVIGLSGGDSKPSASSSGSPSATSSTATSATTGPCAYTPSAAGGNVVDVGLPPDPSPSPTTTRTLAFTTNLGAITMELDGAAAPCNVQSVGWLAQTGFYNGTSCHRLVTSGIFVLQCGDPSGTGSGGPAYKVKDENLTSADYSEGVVAMANSGADTNSSQFFIMTKDSNSGLAKSYTVIGKITAGLNIIQKVAADGTADGSGDGKPKDTLTFTKATVTPAIDTAGASAAPTSASP